MVFIAEMRRNYLHARSQESQSYGKFYWAEHLFSNANFLDKESLGNFAVLATPRSLSGSFVASGQICLHSNSGADTAFHASHFKAYGSA